MTSLALVIASESGRTGSSAQPSVVEAHTKGHTQSLSQHRTVAWTARVRQPMGKWLRRYAMSSHVRWTVLVSGRHLAIVRWSAAAAPASGHIW